MKKPSDALQQRVAASGLLSPGEGVVVAVSGGLDSMVLMHVLRALAREQPLKLVIAHFNHRLRGRCSEKDEHFVREAACHQGLQIIVEKGDVRRLAEREGLSIEMAGRELRHEFLARTARNLGYRVLALGHHADDQVELFFLRLLRGAGLRGLGGMRLVSTSPADANVTLVRPLLGTSRADIRDYALRHGVKFREDASNRSLEFQRNRIRRELLPLLRRRYQPALNQLVLRLTDILRAEDEFMSQVARDTLKINQFNFEELPLGLQRRMIQSQLRDQGLPAGFDLIEKLRVSPGEPVCLGGEYLGSETGESNASVVFRNKIGVLQRIPPGRLAFNPEAMQVTLGRGGKVKFGQLCLSWRVLRRKALHKAEPVPGQELFDADKIGPSIVLRHWQQGDRFQPSGMAQPVKIQDLLTNLKVPRGERRHLVVGVAAQEVFWVQGLRISEHFKLTAESKRRLLWCWKPR